METYHLSNPLQHNPEVKHLQLALKAGNFYNGPIDGTFGQGTAMACKRAKFNLGYPDAFVLPIGGQQLFNYLTGAKGLPLAYQIRRHKRGAGLSKNDKLRQAIVANAVWGVRNEPNIHYTQDSRRDDALHGKPETLPLYTDCSGFATLCYKWAGGPDPNGYNFRLLGFTGSMLDHGVTIPLHDARPADLVIWGGFPGHHVASIHDMENPVDPLLISHGQESGPNYVRLSIETRAQNRPFVVKRYIGI